ncbi:MAG TPA: 6-bladed beta-propeller [Terriglobales bacterium]|nr:6-bladed beta-propeller [Terriglobales bacterium]
MTKKGLAGVGIGIALGLLLLSAWPRTEAESKAPAVLLPPQLEWVGTLRNAADVTPKPGRFKRILKKIIGLDDRQKAMLLPNGVAVDKQGRVLVADTKERLVHVFDSEHKKYKTLRPPDSNPFLAPIAVATDAAGKIYVSDSVRSRVFVFTPEGKFAGAIGAITKDESIFKRCTGLAIDQARERLFVVDTLAMQVVELSLDGKVIARFGKPGNGPGEFNYPTYIAADSDGSVWVMDSLNFRVQHLDASGTFLSGFGHLGDAIGEFDKPKGIALDDQGHIYVTDSRDDRVQVYDRDGRLLFFFGQTGAAEGQFFLPEGIATDRSNRVYVADGYNRRVQIFHLRPGAETGGGGQ